MRLVLGISASMALAGSAVAGGNLVQNGTFTNTTIPYPGGQIFSSAQIPGWTLSGCCVASLLYPGNNGSAFNGGFGLWQLSDSPIAGANMFADDGDFYYHSTLSQVITGLTPGKTYELSFYQAASQMIYYESATTEWWEVTFGDNYDFTTPVQNAPAGGQAPWTLLNYTLVADSTSEVLSFLSQSPDIGVPPVAVLTGISIIPVPEPAGWATMLLGIGGLGALARRRRSLRAA
jgi:hypothetical protein